jgi:hypothetical protein
LVTTQVTRDRAVNDNVMKTVNIREKMKTVIIKPRARPAHTHGVT